MEARLPAAGMRTMRELYALSHERISASGERAGRSYLAVAAWCGRTSSRRGAAQAPDISHQHILPSYAPTRAAARDICLKMLCTCAGRMRKEGHC